MPSQSGSSDRTIPEHRGAASLLHAKTSHGEQPFENIPLMALGEDATYENTKPTRSDPPRRDPSPPPVPPRKISVTEADAQHWLQILEEQSKARKLNQAVIKMARKALIHQDWAQVASISRTAMILVLGSEPCGPRVMGSE